MTNRKELSFVSSKCLYMGAFVCIINGCFSGSVHTTIRGALQNLCWQLCHMCSMPNDWNLMDPNISQRGLSSVVGVRHATDLARHFRFHVLMMEQKNLKLDDVNRA